METVSWTGKKSGRKRLAERHIVVVPRFFSSDSFRRVPTEMVVVVAVREGSLARHGGRFSVFRRVGFRCEPFNSRPRNGKSSSLRSPFYKRKRENVFSPSSEEEEDEKRE